MQQYENSQFGCGLKSHSQNSQTNPMITGLHTPHSLGCQQRRYERAGFPLRNGDIQVEYAATFDHLLGDIVDRVHMNSRPFRHDPANLALDALDESERGWKSSM